MLHNQENLFAACCLAQAVAEQQGRALASVIEALYTGSVDKALSHAQWSDRQKDLIRGVDRILICGTIGLSDPFGTLVREKTRQELRGRLPLVDIQLIPVFEKSGVAAAQGAFLLHLDEQREDEVMSSSYPCAVLLIDIGGTKTYVGIAELNRQLSLKHAGCALADREFPTPKGPPDGALYDGVAGQVIDQIREIDHDEVRLIPSAAVSFAAGFERDDGGVGWLGTGRVAKGFGFNLGPGIPYSSPATELAARMSGFRFHVFTDGVAQYRYAVQKALTNPSVRRVLLGRKVALLGLGTGIGAGFGEVDATGIVTVYPMTHVSDMRISEFQGAQTLDFGLPGGKVSVPLTMPRPTWAKDLLGGRAIEAILERAKGYAVETSIRELSGLFDDCAALANSDLLYARLDARFLNDRLQARMSLAV